MWAAQYNIWVLRCVMILYAPRSTWRPPLTHAHTCTHTHTHTCACWDIPVERWSITGFILFDLHSLNPKSGSPAWAGVSVARCSQSPSYQRCGSVALSLSAISAAHRWLSMWTFSLRRLLCGSWPQNPCHLKNCSSVSLSPCTLVTHELNNVIYT